MTVRHWSGLLLLLAVLHGGATAMRAQADAAGGQAADGVGNRPGDMATNGVGDAPTIRAESRLVIEDVLVMDAQGNPVHGLPLSSFHVLDNGRPQQVRQFEEGTPEEPVRVLEPPLPPGTFTNAQANGPAATSEILLIDTDSMELVDQMFLGEQLKRSVARIPADLPVTIFAVRSGRVIPVLAATTDREAMTRAVGEVVPVQNHAIDSRFQSAVNQLMTVAAVLQQTPGRKNLLWFAGEFPLVPVPATTEAEAGPQPNFSAREHEIHLVQEALAEARVAVFPVDVRGVLPATFSFDLMANVSAGRDQMRDLAAATGGRAYMLNNLSEEVVQAFEVGRSAYTMAYSPTPYSMDQSFHRVTVRVDGGYAASYRMGYLATYTGAPNEAPRTRLTRGGATTVDIAQRKPMVFQVHLLPHGEDGQVSLDFSMPLSELHQDHVSGVWSSGVMVSTYAYDASGKVRSGKVQELDTKLSDAQYGKAVAGEQRVATKQELKVPKGAKYLLVIARDRSSQRTGSLLLQTRLLLSLPAAEGPAAAESR